MEANNEQEVQQQNTEAPAFEQQITDTQGNGGDTFFEEALGLPTPEPTAPPKHEDSQRLVENEIQKETQPEQDFSANEVAPDSNDQIRYQHWQSQAAKLQNQLNDVKEYMPMVDYLRNNPEAVQNLTPGGEQTETKSQEPEEFPPPPEKPEQPAGFSREEAYNDPASDSAKYLDSVDKWRDDMQTYSQLHSQYEIATMRESYNKKIEGLEKVEAQRNQAAKNYQEMQNVRSFVQQKYDLGDDLDDFINTMNDPKSIDMDTLVGYYQYKKGLPAQPQSAPPVNAQPSQAFQQTKRAQSVPQPMGVQPAQNSQTANASPDFMDLLIKDNNKKSIL
tara:strand:- start:3609 stop:4607 length:999 start_codon:yes stop_codon:yes gene_type:complete